MVAPLIWAGVAIAGVAVTGWSARQVDAAADSTTDLVKVALVAGTAYASWRALKAAGVI